MEASKRTVRGHLSRHAVGLTDPQQVSQRFGSPRPGAERRAANAETATAISRLAYDRAVPSRPFRMAFVAEHGGS
jgi:hypothetical protein